ncbi:MAG: hypothetical protein HC914_20560 [Chloroflexaceae bacterium]|nr:hypothetical protein [Chloroflexaceae bacterium]
MIQLFAVYAELLQRATQQSPDLVEMTALASVLHSFYNGLENSFLSIARHVDQQVPTGDRWHRALLVQMAHSTPTRAPVLSAELVATLTEYQSFRHFYRHSYSFFLSWDKRKPLVMDMSPTGHAARTELEAFLNTIGAA